ncbi:protein rolling stone-like [Ruditapes philippinarum]|uniref:protein rolling stone-like n=1 Tax=Ruditapes philippinarum TaxID=129788 RepID=UPI00295B8D20|nr:protein rolling stone-like [Ruditapes philippinarum]
MAGCKEWCKSEFKVKNLLLQHEDPQTFIQFQFGFQKVYLIWRVFWALYHVAWIIVSGVKADLWAGEDSSQYVKWFIFLTDWAYFSLTISTLVDAVVTTYVFVRRTDIREGTEVELPWFMRANWCLFNIGNVISVSTSLAYWGLVYDGSQDMSSVNIATHIINSLYVFLNISVTGMPKRVLHFWFSVIFGMVYALFTVFYHLAGGTNHNGSPYVYSPLDWSKPGTAFLYCAIVCFILVPVVHLILYGIHRLKLLIYEKCDCCRIETRYRRDPSTVEMKPQYPY